MLAPEVVRSDENKEPVKGWYQIPPTLTYIVKDGNIHTVDVYINEANIIHTDFLETKGIPETSCMITIPTDKYKNMEVNVRIVVEDMSKLTKEVTYTYNHDDKFPVEVAADAPKPVNQKGNSVFYNGPFTVQLAATDLGVGVDRFEVNGEVIEGSSFTISEGGQYVFKVYDELGNATEEFKLNELLGWEGDTVVLDIDNPVIDITIPDPQDSKKGDWYNDDFTFTAQLSDVVGLNKVKVTVNGTEMLSQSYEDLDVLTQSYTIDTALATPNPDGSYQITVSIEDNAKLTREWSETVFIDKTNPVIASFIISGDVKITGNTIGGSEEEYGIFFDGKGSIQVNVTDANETSGVYSVWYKLDKQEWVEILTNGESTIYVPIPEDYKGSFKAYAVDNSGRRSEEAMPDGIVSEGSNTHVNSSRIDISFETTNHYDKNNLPLYNKEMSAVVNVSCDWAGLEKLEWGINSETLGVITDFKDAKTWDRNLPLTFDTSMVLTENVNSQDFWVRVTDNAGRVSKNERQFSIDTDDPVIYVNYDRTNNVGYYNSDRTATITVLERNFNSALFNISGSAGKVGAWEVAGPNSWKNTFTFTDDGDYDFSISCSDRAGNISNVVNSGSFTIDKTAPVVNVTYANNAPANDKYYSTVQTAIITVVERNFDPSLMSIQGATITGWQSNGNTHTANAEFAENGVYSIVVNGADSAHNMMVGYRSPEFIVDKDAPVVTIGGISNGVSYKDNINIEVSASDTYLDAENTKVVLSGKVHDDVELEGKLDNEGKLVFSYADFEKVEAVDDMYTLKVLATDLAGSVYEEEVAFSVNRFGSTFEPAEDSILGSYVKDPQDVVLTEVNVDKLDTSKAQIVVTKDGKQVEIDSKYVTIEEEEINGKYMYTYTISKDAFAEEGKYLVQVYSTSEVGDDYTSANEEYSFMVDDSAPEVILSGIESDMMYNEYSKMVTLDIRDTSGIDSVKVTLNGKDIETKYENGLYTFEVVEGSGYSELVVTVTDLAGNTSEVKVTNFLITSNIFTYLWNQTWVKYALVGVLLLVGGLIFLIVRGILKRRKKEKALAETAVKYKSSTLSPNSSSSTTGSETGRRGDEKTGILEDEVTSFVRDDTSTSSKSKKD